MTKIILSVFMGILFLASSAKADTASITIRDGATIFYSGTVTLPDASAVVSVTPTDAGATHDVGARSVTGILYTLDQTEVGFSLSNLTYNSGFSSFYLRCITGTSELCDNWQYYVNGSVPTVGTDATTINNGDVVYVYFGAPHRTTLSTDSTTTGTDVTATAEKYDPISNTFGPYSHITVGATQFDPANPWTPIVSTSTLTNINGVATFYLNTPGSYDVGIAETFYFPTTPLTITDPGTVQITLRVETATTTLFKDTVIVPSCTTPINGHKIINGFCSFAASSLPYDASWSPFGAFVTTVANQIATPSYWTLLVNNEPSFTGIDGYIPQSGDTVLWVLDIPPTKIISASSSMMVGATTTLQVLGFDFISFGYVPLAGATIEGLGTTTAADGTTLFTATTTSSLALSAKKTGYLESNTIKITTSATPSIPAPTTPAPSGGGGGSAPKPAFDQSRALGFLASKQKADGSFGAQLFTDWASLALATQADNDTKAKLKNYQMTSVLQTPNLTDYERHAMALMALGINPYSVKGNVIASIVSGFDGTQFGDTGLVTDDIFAIIPLLKAGYTQDDSIISKTGLFIVSKQQPNGSWEGGSDVTAAAIQALGSLYKVAGVNAALGKASGYLASTQQPDGGWNNIDSTAWVKSALNAVNEGPHKLEFTSAAGNTSGDYLGAAQQSDGGVRPNTDSVDNRVWSTSYALSAASAKSWSSIMQSFPKPTSGGGGGANVTATTSSATSTTATSTITLEIASSTPATTTVSDFIQTASSSPATSTPIVAKKKVATVKKKITTPIAPPAAPTSTPIATSSAAQTQVAAVQNSGIVEKVISFFKNLFGM